MNDQKDLFDFTPPPAAPYGGHPPFEKSSDTSRAASESVDVSAGTMRAKVLEAIKLHRGMTCDQIELHLGLRHQTASARVRELVLMGKLRDAGIRRPTRSGRMAAVWCLKETSTL
jgi:predicted ArsR family transcriptional regulator